MSVQLVHEGLPSDITPYRLKLLLRQARIALGLSKGAVEYLVFAIENCQPSDFQNGRICAIWHSLERLATLFRLSKRQINRIEAELVDAGLIKRTYPERKNRSGDRVDGVIKRAAGINLAPLIEKAEYVRSLVGRQMQADEDHKRLREHIQDLFRQIRELESGEANDAATSILPRRRPGELNDIKEMRLVAVALAAVLADFSTKVSQPEMTDGSDENVRLITKKEKKNKTRTAPQTRGGEQLNTSPAHARLLATSELRRDIDLYALNGPPDWQSINRATHDRAYKLGISRRIWGEMCVRIGENKTALCLIVADRNSQRDDAFGVDNAAAAFTQMTRKVERDLAVLNSLMGELTDALIRTRGNL